MILRVHTDRGYMTIPSIYSPTLITLSEIIDSFYLQLGTTTRDITAGKDIAPMSDFDARIGSDGSSFNIVTGLYGIGKMKDYGQRLLALCASHSPFITNTYRISSLK